MPHRWNRVSMYLRRAPGLNDHDLPPQSLDPRDHAAIQAAIEAALGGLEIADFSVYRIGEQLPGESDHPHVVIDHDVYSALVDIVKHLRSALSQASTNDDRVAAVILAQHALDNYQAACDVSAKRPPHPQIEGPGWRHY